MPPTGAPTTPSPTIEDVIATLEGVSIDAYYFLQEAMQLSSDRIYGPYKKKASLASRHVTGQQLCATLRDLAIERWGWMASVVLRGWGIYSTNDFGRLVFALIDAGHLTKTPTDSIDDFNSVFSFREAFDQRYQIVLTDKAC